MSEPASLSNNRARLTDSPTPLDQLDDAQTPDHSPFKVSPFNEVSQGQGQGTRVSSFRVSPSGPMPPVFSDWNKLDLDDGNNEGRKPDGSAYRIIAVSCRLFIKVTKQPSLTEANGWSWVIEEAPHELLPTALKHLHEDPSFRVPYFHIGWIDTYIEPEDRHELSSLLINKHRCVPVYLEKDEVEGFYHGFCKGVLWPLLHYSLRTKNFANKFKHFGMYQKVNERFADVVLRIHRKGDVVWLHDYHLLLVARKIRERVPTAVIGFFMHSPFPTVELFRQLPVRRDLLEGMLAADVIGFNAYSYCNHHRAACEALLSIDTEGRGLLAPDGRFVRTHISPAGINFAAMEELVTSTKLQERVAARRSESSLQNLKIVVGRSRKLDEAQGTLLRLQAFEEFLKENKEWRGNVVLLEVVDQMAVSADSTLQALVQETVGNINGRYGELGRPPPVHLVQPRESGTFSMEESCEFYMLAHVLMVTPLRDGLSLSSHEAVICQADFPRRDGTVWKGNKAPLILSEFAGAATALGGSIIVNPHDVTAVAREIKRALLLTESECSEAHSHNFQYVKRNTAAFWAHSCLAELTANGSATNNTMDTSIDLKKDMKMQNSIRANYFESSSRLLLLDWDGSLVPLTASREAVLPDSLEELLRRLCEDPCNSVYIMTGRRRSDMEELLGHIPKIGLICEHGAFVRPHGESEWVTLSTQTGWIGQIEDLLTNYSDRTPGSITEVKEAGLTWHWRDADHDFAAWMEKDLVVQLHQRMASLPFSCFIGRRSVEIHVRGASKVQCVQWLLENKCKDIDFVICYGDDRSDDDLFEFIHTRFDQESREFQATPPLGISPPMYPETGVPAVEGGVLGTPACKVTAQTKTPSTDTLGIGGKRKPADKQRNQPPGSPAPGYLKPEVKRWSVKVGPTAMTTHASAVIESQKDAPDLLSQMVKERVRLPSLSMQSPPEEPKPLPKGAAR